MFHYPLFIFIILFIFWGKIVLWPVVWQKGLWQKFLWKKYLDYNNNDHYIAMKCFENWLHFSL